MEAIAEQLAIGNSLEQKEKQRQALRKRRLGMASLSYAVPFVLVDETLARADQCLYAAKHAGRNRVVTERNMPA